MFSDIHSSRDMFSKLPMPIFVRILKLALCSSREWWKAYKRDSFVTDSHSVAMIGRLRRVNRYWRDTLETFAWNTAEIHSRDDERHLLLTYRARPQVTAVMMVFGVDVTLSDGRLEATGRHAANNLLATMVNLRRLRLPVTLWAEICPPHLSNAATGQLVHLQITELYASSASLSSRMWEIRSNDYRMTLIRHTRELSLDKVIIAARFGGDLRANGRLDVVVRLTNLKRLIARQCTHMPHQLYSRNNFAYLCNDLPGIASLPVNGKEDELDGVFAIATVLPPIMHPNAAS